MIQYLFPGLKEGDKWCLCASRWAQALSANVAPKIYLSATHERTLQFATLAQLMAHVRAWLLHDILSRRGFCARINPPCIAPPLTCIAHTIAILLHGYCAKYDPPPDPPSVC